MWWSGTSVIARRPAGAATVEDERAGLGDRGGAAGQRAVDSSSSAALSPWSSSSSTPRAATRPGAPAGRRRGAAQAIALHAASSRRELGGRRTGGPRRGTRRTIRRRTARRTLRAAGLRRRAGRSRGTRTSSGRSPAGTSGRPARIRARISSRAALMSAPLATTRGSSARRSDRDPATSSSRRAGRGSRRILPRRTSGRCASRPTRCAVS